MPGVIIDRRIYLEISQVRRRGVKKTDGGKLNSGVQAHVLKATKACDESSSPFPVLELATRAIERLSEGHT
jgi:hypothetical protein